MSKISNNRETRISALLKVFYSISNKEEAKIVIEKNRDVIDHSIPSDIIFLVDKLVRSDLPIEKIKTGINKFLNVMYKTIESYPYVQPGKGSFIDTCIKNNNELKKKLKLFQSLIKKINKNPGDKNLQMIMLDDLKIISEFNNYYIIKENVIFPHIEREWKEQNCLKIMWSFHDDIRGLFKNLIAMLSNDDFNLRDFNKYIGALYFNMNAIIFREERILFPYIMETISENIIDSFSLDSSEIGFPYIMEEKNIVKKHNLVKSDNLEKMYLKSGNLSIDQIILIFNHLPVDITFVDENNKVIFFSNPKKRIFPRTNSIIGRDVKNCHPPESVNIVEKIIDSFKQGLKDIAEFWIKIGDDEIFIQYFALRDDLKKYRGVIEVSQVITDIKKIRGEKKLLEWE